MNLPRFKKGDKVLNIYSSFRGMWMVIDKVFIDYETKEYWYNCDYNAWDDEKEARFRAYPEDELVKKE